MAHLQYAELSTPLNSRIFLLTKIVRNVRYAEIVLDFRIED